MFDSTDKSITVTLLVAAFNFVNISHYSIDICGLKVWNYIATWYVSNTNNTLI